jgi:hypothetical protein
MTMITEECHREEMQAFARRRPADAKTGGISAPARHLRTNRKERGTRRVEKGSGNVFADLGLPHPEQELLKAKLILQIYRLIKRRDLKQAEAGKILGIQ